MKTLFALINFVRALLLIANMQTAEAVQPWTLAGTWGGKWTSTSRYHERSGFFSCPGGTFTREGEWAATLSPTGDVLGGLTVDGKHEWLMRGTLTTAGEIDLGTMWMPCYNSHVVLRFDTQSAHAGASCSATGQGFILISGCSSDHEITLTGGRVALEQATRKYDGLWWSAPAGSQSGWGLNLVHQGDALFATWFTYGKDGNGIWLVMPEAWRIADGAYTGTVYHTTGPAFDAASWDTAKVHYTAVGSAAFTFTDADHGEFLYSVHEATDFYNGFSAAWKPITKFAFASPVPVCEAADSREAPPNYQGLWWKPSESGWGVNVAHQGDSLFATWFTYDAKGQGMWLVMSNGVKRADGSYAGTLYRTGGSTYAWSAANVKYSEVGTAVFAFTDRDNGTFSYTVNGVAQSKQVRRFVFASPPTVCR